MRDRPKDIYIYREKEIEKEREKNLLNIIVIVTRNRKNSMSHNPTVATFIFNATSISVMLLSVFESFMISIPQCDRCWGKRGSITKVSSSDAYDHTSAEFAVIVPVVINK